MGKHLERYALGSGQPMNKQGKLSMCANKLEPQFGNFLTAQGFLMVSQACILQADGVLLQCGLVP